MRYLYSDGFTLIEVLISLMLLSLMLLGFDAMEIHSLRTLRASYYFHVATQQLTVMAERLQALGAHAGLEEQKILWNRQNQQLLPEGIGTVTGSYPLYVITVYWGKIKNKCDQISLGQSGCVKNVLQI